MKTTVPPSMIWITRAQPAAAVTAARVRALGLSPIIAPLLVVRPVDTPINMDGVVALAFTSANGVAAFTARSPRRDLEVFTVGDATASAARAEGFLTVTSADGDGMALAELIVQAQSEAAAPQGVVLAPGPRNPAVDLMGALERRRIPVRAVVLYETLDVEVLPEAVRSGLADRTIAAVLIHSTRAAEVFAARAAPFDLSSLRAVGLSASCLAPLSHLALRDRRIALVPREDALLEALSATLGKPPAAR